MVNMSGADAIVQALKAEGVEVMFGIPGGATMPLYDSLKDSGIRHILARHEQSAAHMADGFARASGRVGVCSGTSGPGATNLLTGIATAYLDSYPVVAITGQVARPFLATDAFQEVDTVGIFNPVVKYSFQPLTPGEIPMAIKSAFYIASTGRTGPVLVDVPKDVQMESADMDFNGRVEIKGYNPSIAPDAAAVERAAEMLLAAERPLILLGGGAIKANVTPSVLAMAELLMVPVASTLMGKGAIPEDHFLSTGPVGMHGTYHANTLIMESDLVVNIGGRFSDRTTMKVDEFTRERKMIQMDIDPTEAGKNIRNAHFIIGDLSTSVGMLYEAVKRRVSSREETPWYRRMKELRSEYDGKVFQNDGPFSSPHIVKKIRELLPADAIVTTDVGQVQMWGELFYKVLKPRTYLTSGGLGTMGFGLPAALGAKVARPDVPVVVLAGDGSFAMTNNSLATSIVEKIPVVVCIFNNSNLGMISQWQRVVYGGRYSASWLGDSPDFSRLAQAYGAEGIRVNSMEDFEKSFKEALNREVTTVIDMEISPSENVYPFVPSGNSLKEMLTK